MTDMNSMFYNCSALTNLNAPKNISAALYLLSCTNLTVESLMSVINNLATVTSSKKLILGTINLAKLIDEQK